MTELKPRRITHSCGMCGVALGENGTIIEPPMDYNPDNYPHVWCDDCAMEHYEKERYRAKARSLEEEQYLREEAER